MKALVITIRGTKAEPAGSKVRGRWGGVRDDNKNLKPWKAIVATKAETAITIMQGAPLPALTLPLWGEQMALILDVIELRARPASHFTTKGALSAQGRRFSHPTSKPDRGKILRGIEDALIGLVYRDDSQIVDGRVLKRWSSSARTVIIVAPADDSAAMLERFHTLQALAAAESLER